MIKELVNHFSIALDYKAIIPERVAANFGCKFFTPLSVSEYDNARELNQKDFIRRSLINSIRNLSENDFKTTEQMPSQIENIVEYIRYAILLCECNGINISLDNVVDKFVTYYINSNPNAFREFDDKVTKFDYREYARQNILSVFSHPLSFAMCWRTFLYSTRNEHNAYVLGLNVTSNTFDFKSAMTKKEKQQFDLKIGKEFR